MWFRQLHLFGIYCYLYRIRIVYWWNVETTITHQDLWLGNLSLALTREVNSNTILCIFSRWDQRIGEGIPIPDSRGEEATFINICISNGSLKSHRVLISTMPSFGDKVIFWYTGFTFKDSGYLHDGRADKNPYPHELRILICVTVVPMSILIRTTAIISASSEGYSYPSWWLMCNWYLFNWFNFILWYLLDFATNMF